jgi:hypothetical protein
MKICYWVIELLLAVRETNTAKLGAFIATSCEQQDRQMR